jgi:predicted nuclease with TOPRIM domain
MVDFPQEPTEKPTTARKEKMKERSTSSRPGKAPSLLKKLNELKEEKSRLEEQLRVLKGKFQEGETFVGLGALAEISQLVEKSCSPFKLKARIS